MVTRGVFTVPRPHRLFPLNTERKESPSLLLFGVCSCQMTRSGGDPTQQPLSELPQGPAEPSSAPPAGEAAEGRSRPHVEWKSQARGCLGTPGTVLPRPRGNEGCTPEGGGCSRYHPRGGMGVAFTWAWECRASAPRDRGHPAVARGGRRLRPERGQGGPKGLRSGRARRRF